MSLYSPGSGEGQGADQLRPAQDYRSHPRKYPLWNRAIAPSWLWFVNAAHRSYGQNKGRGPCCFFLQIGMGRILLNIGRPAEAIGLVEKALRLNPHSPYEIFLGEAYYLTGRYEEAVVAQNRILARNPNLWPAHLLLAAAYSKLGREGEARAAAAEVLRLSPKFSLEGWRQSSLQKDQTALERTVAALRKAGLK